MADPRPQPLTQLSFEAARQELIDRINALKAMAGRLPLDTDHATNPHLIIIEALALYIELNGATIDNRKLGALLVLCRNLEDAVLAAESIGYDWAGVSPAVATVHLNFGAGWPKDIVLVKGRKWLASPSYEQDDEITIPAGTTAIDVPVRQVTTNIHTVFSNGTAEQVFVLPQSPVVKRSAYDGVVVTVDSVEYDVVDLLFELSSGAEGIAFRVRFDETAEIRTGTGINGVLIPLNAQIDTQYQTSLGFAGRIAASVIIAPVGTILDVDGGTVTVTVTQPIGSSGGADRESLEAIKFNGPRSLRTLKASIGKTDFEANATEVAGVLRALVVTNNQDPSVPPNITKVLIASTPSGGGETVLFTDEHADPDINDDVWAIKTLPGDWSQSGGQLLGASDTAQIELTGIPLVLPLELRLNLRTLGVTPGDLPVQVRLNKASDPLDYLFVEIGTDGTDTTFRVGQVLSAVETANTEVVTGYDAQTVTEVVIRYTLEDGLELESDTGSGLVPVESFDPDVSFRTDLFLRYKGKIGVTDTVTVILLELPTPNQQLIDDVEEHFATERLTLVSHNVEVGPLRFRPDNLAIRLFPLSGYTLSQAYANVLAALDALHSVTRRDEDGEFINLPGVGLYLSEVLTAIQQATGVHGAVIVWPTTDDLGPEELLQPNPQEMFIRGEVVLVP